jgi:hypothetical protein
MPQISYLVRSQLLARLANPATGFNYWLQQACQGQEAPQPVPYVIDWSLTSSNLWLSNITSEELDATSTPGDGTLCLLYGLGFENMTPSAVVKFAVFAGTVTIAVVFDIAWDQQNAPHDTESILDATDQAMITALNAASYYSSWSDGVIYNGQVAIERERLRASGSGWRQRLPYRISFDLQA